jgi:hypothetical protein
MVTGDRAPIQARRARPMPGGECFPGSCYARLPTPLKASSQRNHGSLKIRRRAVLGGVGAFLTSASMRQQEGVAELKQAPKRSRTRHSSTYACAAVTEHRQR